MSHNCLDTWIQGQLASFAYSESSEQNNSQELNNRIKYQYCYNAHYIAHIRSNGMTEITHGNSGRISIRSDRAFIDDQTKQELNNFLHNYATIHGYPSPGRHMQKSTMPIISLPMDTTYNSIYEEYINTVKFIKGEDYKAMAFSTFHQIWNEIAPDIRFMSKASDLCDKCEQLRANIHTTDNIDNKQKYQAEYNLHRAAATIERQYYNENIEITIINQSKKDGSNIAVKYDKKNKIEWNYYDFETFFKPYFIKCNGIRTYRHFYFYHDQPGKVFMTLEPNGLKKEAIIRNNLSFDPHKPLNTISLKPISLKRQTQLFKDIRPYVHDPYKDELCFAPNENNENSDSN
ncbi:15724_t:CDS:2 [Cetraspora pellucida]|uniref:15724_t:CDS:1 n=1 Tax=Cetraspora pellucida TaxID=1433469 RepID=A0ACA9P0D7_9GLOM|nr:15724_t:CDS:2 [Cetraspora pellucida]